MSAIVPGLTWWCVGLPVWLLTLSFISARNGYGLPSIPTRLSTGAIILIMVPLGVGFLGPLPILILALVILVWFIRTLYRWKRGTLPEGSRPALVVSALAVLVLGGASLAGYLHYRSLSPAERVLERSGPGVEIELAKLGPPSAALLPVYQQILRESDPPRSLFYRHEIAKRVAKIEDPEVAVPILLEILEAVEVQPGGEGKYILHDRLETLTGIDCPINTTAKEWGELVELQ